MTIIPTFLLAVCTCTIRSVDSVLATNYPPIAIARPFSSADADLLPESFEPWIDSPPCPENSTVKVDLFLVYSQNLDDSVQAQAAIRAAQEIFERGEVWSSCISNVYGFGVNLEAALDIYKPEEQSVNPLWVNGPNRQFERTVRGIQDMHDKRYEILYLMEMDSVPVQKYWLHAIIEQIRVDPVEFTILGR